MSTFETELAKLIEERIDGLGKQIIDGMMAVEQYRYMAGQIAGLRSALLLCDEANSNIAKR